MGAASITLVHSPLVGPGTWRAVSRRLEARGREAPMPKIHLDDLEAPWDVAIAGGVAAQLDGAPTVLAVHSGAGALVPALANRLDLAAVLFVDAILPTPGRSWFDTAPASLQEHLRNLAQGGLLPPWPAWFGEAVMSRLLPYAPLREAFEADCPPLPLNYFEAPASIEPMPPGMRLRRRSWPLRMTSSMSGGRPSQVAISVSVIMPPAIVRVSRDRPRDRTRSRRRGAERPRPAAWPTLR